MKVRHIPIFAVAILVSLVLHGVLWQTSRVVPVHPAITPPTSARRASPSFTFTLNVPGPDGKGAALPAPDRTADPKPQPDEKTIPAAPPKAPEKREVERYPDLIGRQDGKGIGTHEAQGQKPLKARVADNDQPWLSRDPRGPALPFKPPPSMEAAGDGGSGGANGGPPAPQVVAAQPPLPKEIKPIEHAENGELRPGPVDVKIPTHAEGQESDAQRILDKAKVVGPVTPERPGVDQTKPPADPRESGQRQANVRAPDPVPSEKGRITIAPPPPPQLAMSPPPAPLVLQAPPPRVGAEIPQPTPAAQTPAVVAQTAAPTKGAGGRPGNPAAPADPAQESDSEVDAFSKIDGTVRQDGRLDVQFGRQVKTVRPRLPISAMIDAALGARSVTLRVNIGRDGNVTAVSVSTPSGSNEVDQASLLAMYDWWFEPAKDKKGEPVPDVIYFTLNFR